MRRAALLAAALLLAGSARADAGERLADPGFDRGGWQAFGAGFAPAPEGRRGAGIVCANRTDREARGALAVVVLNQKTPTPVLATGWSRAAGVEGLAGPDYSLYLDVEYADGTNLWGQSASFAAGTHGWQRQRVLVRPEKPIRTLRVYALFRNRVGTAWFDDFSVAEMGGAGVFDSQRLAAPTLPARVETGWFVRDVAADGPLRPIAPGRPALGLRLALRSRGDTTWADLSAAPGPARAVTLVYAERAGLRAVRWHDDIRSGRPARTGDFANVAPVALGAAGALSPYPFAAVTGSGGGRALAIPPELGPRVARLGYHADSGLLYAAFDLALDPGSGKGGAAVAVTRFPVDPAWGFRDAAARYARRFPDAFRRRARAEGIWIPFTDPGIVAGLADFGIAYHEGDNAVAGDDARGILSFRYTEPMSWWMPMPKGTPRTYDAAMAMVREKASGSDPEQRRWAQALLRSGAQGADGRFLGDFRDTPWADGIAWVLSPDPKLPRPPGEAIKADLVYTRGDADARYRTDGAGLDGEYLDSLEMFADLPNHRPEQLRATSLPLTFASDTLLPTVPVGFSVWEQTRAMAQDLRRRGKLLFANSVPVRFGAFAPLLDVMGIETDWLPGPARDRYVPERDAAMNLRRTLSGTKPYLLLQNTDLERFGPYVERYFQRAMFYGIHPSFFSIDAANDNYWDRPKWLERDRPLFRRYQPTIRALSAAGWEPVTHARTDRADLWIERFGREWLTVLNAGSAARTARLTVDLARMRGAAPAAGKTVRVRDAVTGETLARLPAAATVRVAVPLAADQARALRLTLE